MNTSEIPLEYGSVAYLPKSVKHEAIRGQGIFAGINERDEYVVLTKYFSNARAKAFVGKSCTIELLHDNYNIHAKPRPTFIMDNLQEVELNSSEEFFARQFMKRRRL